MRVGVLIIGSLYWDRSPVRCAWRRDRLDCSDPITVRAPIRYGRKSGTRGDTYTMVFSMQCDTEESRGTALVMPCRAACCAPEHLVEEARWLWAAEDNAMFSDLVGKNFGRVCLLWNPEATPPQDFVRAWRALVSSDSYRQVPKANGEPNVLDLPNGAARFAWPPDVASRRPLAGFDLLLMTATEPSLQDGEYADAPTIAKAWREDPRHNVQYFYNNCYHGITTFQDQDILRVLRGEAN